MVNIDDAMTSRPGGLVRQKVSGAVEPIVTPPIGQEAYQMMDYLDQVRAGRVGVHPEGQIQVDNIGDRVGSQGIQQLMTAREAVVGLIVRVIAEGVKEFKANPEKYQAITYQNNTISEAWPVDRHTYTLVLWKGTDGLEAQGVVPRNGKKTMLSHVKK